MRPRQNSDSGQDLVEYAIVFPVLMLLLLGVFEFGRIIYSYNAISNLAREGARFGVVPSRRSFVQGVDVTEACPGSNPIVQDVCSHALALPGTLSVTVNQEDASGLTDPDIVHVAVAYDGSFLTSLLKEMIGHCICPFILQSAATMRLE